MSGGVPVPVDRLQDVTCVRRMAFHGDHIICRLGDQGRGLAGGVQRIHCDDMSRDVTPLQQVLGGRDLATLVVDVEHRKRRTGRMIGERDRLVMPLPVAVGGTDALAIRRPCCRERTTRACPTMHDILERLGVDGLEHAVNGGLGDRDGATRLWVAPRPHGLELRLGEGTGAFRGRDTALHVGEVGEDMDREDTGDRVLTSLCPANVGNVRELRGERA